MREPVKLWMLYRPSALLGPKTWKPGSEKWKPGSETWKPGSEIWKPGSEIWKTGFLALQKTVAWSFIAYSAFRRTKKCFSTSTLWLFVINLLGLLKNKPSLIIYQMQIDDKKVLTSFYKSLKKNLGIKGLMFFWHLLCGSAWWIC